MILGMCYSWRGSRVLLEASDHEPEDKWFPGFGQSFLVFTVSLTQHTDISLVRFRDYKATPTVVGI